MTICYYINTTNVGAYLLEDASIFGMSDLNPLLGEVHCVGTEPELFECSHTSIGSHSCGLNQSFVPDLAISCYGK